jgi:hypothetical protein
VHVQLVECSSIDFCSAHCFKNFIEPGDGTMCAEEMTEKTNKLKNVACVVRYDEWKLFHSG